MTQATIRIGVIATIAQLVGRSADQISVNDNLIDDLGVDSIVAVKLLSSIEDCLGVRLPTGSESSLLGIWTVGELVDRLTLVLADDVKTDAAEQRA